MENNGFEGVYARLEKVLTKGLNEEVFPGVAAGVWQYAKGEEKRLVLTRGRTRNDVQGRAVIQETLFDLASLTKPLCTTLAILCLMEQKELAPATKIFDILAQRPQPEYREITVEHLLSHSGGLRAYKPVYTSFSPVITAENKEEIVRLFVREKLASTPGTACLYSDIGFILLGMAAEKVSGKGLDIFFRQHIAEPLQIQEKVGFRKITLPRKGNENIAATEYCPWRQRALQGEVHDEHAWLMNGVAGHAGLFGTIDGVLDLTVQLLHHWRGRGPFPGFSRQLLQLALRKKYRDYTWGWGFDTPSPRNSSAGVYFSPGSVGHLGFTGTSFWIDPEKEVVVVLLTNRVHPSRTNEKIKGFRPVFHNAVMEGLRG